MDEIAGEVVAGDSEIVIATKDSADSPGDASLLLRRFGYHDSTPTSYKIQELALSEPFTTGDYVLFEVDKHLADEVIDRNKSLTVRGQQSDNFVICTEDQALNFKEVEFSNTFLIVKGVKGLETCEKNEVGSSLQLEDSRVECFNRCEVVAITNSYLEFAESVTKTSHLRNLLKIHSIDLQSLAEKTVFKGLNYETLLNEIQLSELQIKSELENSPIVINNGEIFYLDDCLRWRILDDIIRICEETDGCDENGRYLLSFDVLRKSIAEYVWDNIVSWAIREFCFEIDSTKEAFVLDEKRVARSRTEQIIKIDKTKEWKIDDFVREVEIRMPSNFKFDLSSLRGLALTHDSLILGKVVRPVLLEDMPVEMDSRLQKLFSLQNRWTFEEIEPYLLDFNSNPSKIEQFLMKHCRILRHGSTKLFSLKKL